MESTGHPIILDETDVPYLLLNNIEYPINPGHDTGSGFKDVRLIPPIGDLSNDWMSNPKYTFWVRKNANPIRVYPVVQMLRVAQDSTLNYFQLNIITNSLHVIERESFLLLTRNLGYQCRVHDSMHLSFPFSLPKEVFYIGMHKLVNGVPVQRKLVVDLIQQSGFLDLNPNTYVFICNDLIETIQDPRVGNVMAKVLLTSAESYKPVFNTFVMAPKVFYDRYPTIVEFHFQIRRSNGQLADAFDHSFTLDIIENIDTIPTAGYDTRRGVITDTSFKYTF
jgi:hypothetical protein